MDTAMKGYLESALDSLGMTPGSEHGMYAPLVKRHPLRVGDEVPAHIKRNLDEHHTCACTDSNIVYVDIDNAREMFKRARDISEKAGNEPAGAEWWYAENNFKTILVHEYTHILMRHVEAGIKFTRANGDKYYPIFALACDIEANRGYGIRSDSDIYQIGVTDVYYPECQGVNGLMNIYRVLKKNYGDEILNDYSEQQQKLGSEDGEDGESEQNEEPNSQASSDEKDSKSKTAKSESSDEGEGGSAEPTSSEEQMREGRKQALQRAVQSMEEMKEEMEELASMMTEEELDSGLEQFDEETGEGNLDVDGHGSAVGGYDGTPKQVLDAVYNQHLAKKVENAISSLKNLVRGSQIRNREKTYSRQSRKEGADGLIRKGVKSKKVLAPRILVAMDSSGSMNSTEVTPVATAIGTVAKMLGKTKGSFICEHDAYVKNVMPLSKWEEVVKGYYPHGDNDFDEVLKKAIELDVEMVINVGDGYCEFYDRDAMKVAHDKGIKWVDVQVCGSQQLLKSRVIDEEAPRFGDYYIGREIIKVGGEN